MLASILSSCAPTLATRGNFIKSEEVDKITVGVDSKTDILLRYGSPSTTSTFEENIWYYVGQRVESSSFRFPQVREHQALAMSFDDNNVLEAFVIVRNDGLREVERISKATPTAGRQLTILEQLLGNVGRF